MTKLNVMEPTEFWRTILPNQEERYRRAVAVLEAAGVVFTDIVDSCCRSCARYEELFKVSSTGLGAWTFIGQDGHLKWLNGYLYNGEPSWYNPDFNAEEDEDKLDSFEEEERAEEAGEEPYSIHYTFAQSIYVYAEDPDFDSIAVPALITKAFRDEGFEVEWDGSAERTPQIIFFR